MKYETFGFRCQFCKSELVVHQDCNVHNLTYPATCRIGCNKSKVNVLRASPSTSCQFSQSMTIREVLPDSNKVFHTLNIEVNQKFVSTVKVGSLVIVTGVIEHSENAAVNQKADGKTLEAHFKCCNLEVVKSLDSLKHVMLSKSNIDDLLDMMKTQPSPFKTLVDSFCPDIVGWKEIKAALILAMVSGSYLLKEGHRSESHILLFGHPGLGKSKLLAACEEVTLRGVYVNGPLTTAVGLTASAAGGVITVGPL